MSEEPAASPHLARHAWGGPGKVAQSTSGPGVSSCPLHANHGILRVPFPGPTQKKWPHQEGDIWKASSVGSFGLHGWGQGSIKEATWAETPAQATRARLGPGVQADMGVLTGICHLYPFPVDAHSFTNSPMTRSVRNRTGEGARVCLARRG